jgi:hypothetical protein
MKPVDVCLAITVIAIMRLSKRVRILRKIA